MLERTFLVRRTTANFKTLDGLIVKRGPFGLPGLEMHFLVEYLAVAISGLENGDEALRPLTVALAPDMVVMLEGGV